MAHSTNATAIVRTANVDHRAGTGAKIVSSSKSTQDRLFPAPSQPLARPAGPGCRPQPTAEETIPQRSANDAANCQFAVTDEDLAVTVSNTPEGAGEPSPSAPGLPPTSEAAATVQPVAAGKKHDLVAALEESLLSAGISPRALAYHDNRTGVVAEGPATTAA